MRHSRDSALRLTLPPEAGPVVAMIPRKGQLEVFTQNATYAALLPDQMDKQRQVANLPPATKKLASVGASNPIVARVYLQAHEIMGNFALRNSAPDEILDLFHTSKDAVLQADQVASELFGEYESLINAAKGAGFKVIDGTLQAPHIENLNNRLADFFRHAKYSIQAVGEAFNLFYGLKSSDGPVKNGNFEFARKHLARQPEPYQEYLAFLDQSKFAASFITRARNGFEHQGKDTLQISNFEIHDGNLVAPLWSFPSEKPTGVFLDLLSLMDFLVKFSEGNFVHCFLDNVNCPMPFQIVQIPEDEINPDYPKSLRLELVR